MRGSSRVGNQTAFSSVFTDRCAGSDYAKLGARGSTIGGKCPGRIRFARTEKLRDVPQDILASDWKWREILLGLRRKKSGR
jgi:hypothetical protein